MSTWCEPHYARVTFSTRVALETRLGCTIKSDCATKRIRNTIVLPLPGGEYILNSQ